MVPRLQAEDPVRVDRDGPLRIILVAADRHCGWVLGMSTMWMQGIGGNVMDPQHQEKCRELIDEIASRLKLECYRLYHSGGIDPEDYSVDDYRLAKILVTASVMKAVDWYYPTRGEDRTAMKNMTFF
jgi:hypothetical protein